MHLTLKRGFDDGKVCLGMLQVPELDYPLYTLEEPWKENQRNISCIPTGVYRCTPTTALALRMFGVWNQCQVARLS
jgi:hypothetical protein